MATMRMNESEEKDPITADERLIIILRKPMAKRPELDAIGLHSAKREWRWWILCAATHPPITNAKQIFIDWRHDMYMYTCFAF